MSVSVVRQYQPCGLPWVLASSDCSRSFARRSRSTSTCSGVRLSDRGVGPRPASAPASRDRRHSTTREEYSPSQQHALRARLGRLVLSQNRQLVLGGE